MQELLKLAEAADQTPVPDGMSLPEELKRREERLAAIAEAKAKIEARAQERFAHEQAEYEAKVAARQAQAAAAGKKPKGRAPKPPESGPRSDDQINLTDEESRIMPDAGGGFEQSYNAQAIVDNASMLVLVAHVSQATNDKQQLQPWLQKLQTLPAGLNRPETLSADSGYYSEKNVLACQDAKIEPLIAVKREGHHPDWKERFGEPQPLPEGATPVETMKHKLKTRAGKAAYALRKQTVEPVFGILKSVMGFRQFLASAAWRMSATSGRWSVSHGI